MKRRDVIGFTRDHIGFGDGKRGSNRLPNPTPSKVRETEKQQGYPIRSVPTEGFMLGVLQIPAQAHEGLGELSLSIAMAEVLFWRL